MQRQQYRDMPNTAQAAGEVSRPLKGSFTPLALGCHFSIIRRRSCLEKGGVKGPSLSLSDICLIEENKLLLYDFLLPHSENVTQTYKAGFSLSTLF